MRKVVFLSGLLLAVATIPVAVSAEDLAEIYIEAVNNDPELSAALSKRDSIAESKPQSLAKLLPSLSASAGANRVRQHIKSSPFPGNTGLQLYDDNTFSLNLLQPIYHHDYWVQLSQADSFIAQAEAEYQAAQQALIVRAAQSYFAVLSAMDELMFATAEKGAIARQLEQAKERFEVGLIAVTDVHEAQAGFDLARAGEILAINEVDNSWERLHEIINRRPSSLKPLIEQLPLVAPVPVDIEAWRSAAIEGNLELTAARAGTQAVKENIALQRSGHFPTLDIVGSVGLTDTDKITGSRTDTRTIGLQLNVPIFEGGAVNSRTRQAQFDFQEAQRNLDKTLRSVERQVKDAYRGVLTSMSQVEALHAAVVSSVSALEATEAGFEVGTRTMVDVLAEQRNLFRAKRNYSRARYDYILNGLKLKQAAGSLSQADIDGVNKVLAH
jgi:outer membrane protein